MLKINLLQYKYNTTTIIFMTTENDIAKYTNNAMGS